MFKARETRLRLALGLFAALGALLIGKYIFFDQYITTDEHSFIFQAWLFIQGELRLDCPPISDAFFHRMIICDDQAGWVSRYPPAHIIWLIPGVAIGYPRLMTGLAAFLSVWFISKAGNRLGIPTWMSALLLLISPYFWLMQGSVLSHTSALAASSLMIWAYFVWIQEGKINYAAIAGLAWAFLFLGRPYTAVWIALPFAIDALIRLARNKTRPNFSGTLVFAICAAVGIALYLAYNQLITGDAFKSTFLYYDPSEGPGFGIRRGLPHTLAIGWSFVQQNISQLNVNLWGFTGSLFVWLLLSFIGWHKSLTPLLLAAALLVWLAYGAFWFIGIKEIQPVYYYETLPFIILSAAMGFRRLLKIGWILPVWSKIVLTTALLLFVTGSAWQTFYNNASITMQRSGLIQAMQQTIEDVPPNSMVILQDVHRWSLENNTWNPQGLESDPLVVRDAFGASLVLPKLFPDRNMYVVSGKPPARPRLLEESKRSKRIIRAHRTVAKTGEKKFTDKQISYIAQHPKHPKGILGSAVRQFMLRGSHEVTFSLHAKGVKGDNIGRVELIDITNGKTIAQQTLRSGDKRITLVANIFDTRIIEPRVHFGGEGSLEFHQIEIRMTDREPEVPASPFNPAIVLPLLS